MRYYIKWKERERNKPKKIYIFRAVDYWSIYSLIRIVLIFFILPYIEINLHHYLFLKPRCKIHPYSNFVNKRSCSNVHWNALTASFPRLPISASGRRAIVIPEPACRVSRVISGTTCEQNLAHKFQGMEMASRPISLAIFPSFSSRSIPARLAH